MNVRVRLPRMEAIAIALSAGALLFSFVAIGRAGTARRAAEDVQAGLRRQLAGQADELETTLAALREQLARLAAGETLDADQIREGRLWRDMREDEARTRVESGELLVLDVRTHRETTGGVIPGALLIPMDELEARHHQVTQDPRPTLVVCAMGVRSAAACEYLAQAGHFALFNLETGMSGWRGTLESPG